MSRPKLDYLHSLRMHELDLVVGLALVVPDRKIASILEIGAGTGAQARELERRGFEVKAIDVAESGYSGDRVWPVQDYDGKHIPFPERSFDLVFSSSVLEHIPFLESFQSEMLRVLKPDGIAIHVLPNAGWRFWTSMTYYPYLLKRLVMGGVHSPPPPQRSAAAGSPQGGDVPQPPRPFVVRMLGKLLPPRHGETGNFISETYYFSRRHWTREFRRSGWVVVSVSGCGLFYSGNALFGSVLPIRVRQFLARWLGSVTSVFVLKKP